MANSVEVNLSILAACKRLLISDTTSTTINAGEISASVASELKAACLSSADCKASQRKTFPKKVITDGLSERCPYQALQACVLCFHKLRGTDASLLKQIRPKRDAMFAKNGMVSEYEQAAEDLWGCF
jgi:hypothetical protein